jgi:hypothetical protein
MGGERKLTSAQQGLAHGEAVKSPADLGQNLREG